MNLKDDFKEWLKMNGVQSHNSQNNYCWPLNHTYIRKVISINPNNPKYEYVLVQGVMVVWDRWGYWLIL